MTSAAVMTYDSLVSDVALYLERNDTTTLNQIPRFIMLAEQVMASEIKFLGNIQVVSYNMTAANPILDKPVLWHKTVSMNVTNTAGTISPIFKRTYEYVRNYAPNPTTMGLPVYYADYDYTHWILGPTPDVAYAAEILYYARVVPLDSTNQTNWFTNYAPQALLYGTLLQAMPFVKNDTRLPMWKTEYEKIMATLRNEDLTRVADRQNLVIDS